MNNFPLGDIGLPAPPWLFIGLLLLIFFLHLISMWLLLGSLIVGLVEIAKTKVNWEQALSLRYLPIIMALVINLGVPPLLFLQVLYPPFFFSSSIIIAAPWFTVFLLVMASYGFIYAARYGAKKKWQAILFLSISALTALWVSFTFSNNMSLMIKPAFWQELYSYKQNGLNLYPNLPEVISRWAWVLSPLFVAGATLLKRSKYWSIATAIIGAVALLAYRSFLPPEVLNHSLVNIGTIVDFTLLGVLLVMVFVPLKNQEFSKPIFFSWLALKGLTVVAIRHGIRAASLDPIYPLAKLPIEFQPYVLTIFLVALVIGVIALGWMFVKGSKELDI
ncbi:MAG: hypothetical protein SFU25_10385 [Candidatus Caenarcaniphilales bacterium]|nr:hypothetical protein [Candidatus Caenarcaniphilales bacterium]